MVFGLKFHAGLRVKMLMNRATLICDIETKFINVVFQVFIVVFSMCVISIMVYKMTIVGDIVQKALSISCYFNHSKY